jgi:predicted dehydrogenase
MSMRQEVVLHGHKALLRVPSPFNPGYLGQAELILESGPLREELRVERFHHADPYVLEIENFGRTLREGQPFPCPLEFSQGTQRMVDMVFEAEGQG